MPTKEELAQGIWWLNPAERTAKRLATRKKNKLAKATLKATETPKKESKHEKTKKN